MSFVFCHFLWCVGELEGEDMCGVATNSSKSSCQEWGRSRGRYAVCNCPYFYYYAPFFPLSAKALLILLLCAHIFLYIYIWHPFWYGAAQLHLDFWLPLTKMQMIFLRNPQHNMRVYTHTHIIQHNLERLVILFWLFKNIITNSVILFSSKSGAYFPTF